MKNLIFLTNLFTKLFSQPNAPFTGNYCTIQPNEFLTEYKLNWNSFDDDLSYSIYHRGQECGVGYVEDCSGDWDCCPESWIGDGYADCADQLYGCDLSCYDFDGGDCEYADDGCPTGEGLDLLDCIGQNYAGNESWIGDGICDDSTWGFYFNCEEFDCDGGDCDCESFSSSSHDNNFKSQDLIIEQSLSRNWNFVNSIFDTSYSFLNVYSDILKIKIDPNDLGYNHIILDSIGECESPSYDLSSPYNLNAEFDLENNTILWDWENDNVLSSPINPINDNFIQIEPMDLQIIPSFQERNENPNRNLNFVVHVYSEFYQNEEPFELSINTISNETILENVAYDVEICAIVRAENVEMGTISNWTEPECFQTPIGCDSGDANNDGLKNILDIFSIVIFILEDNSTFLLCADLNLDGNINIIDINILVDIILNQ